MKEPFPNLFFQRELIELIDLVLSSRCWSRPKYVRTFPTDDFFKFHSQKVGFPLRRSWARPRHRALCLDILETVRRLCLVFCRAARSLSCGPPEQVDWQKWCWWQWRLVGFCAWIDSLFLERCWFIDEFGISGGRWVWEAKAESQVENDGTIRF